MKRIFSLLVIAVFGAVLFSGVAFGGPTGSKTTTVRTPTGKSIGTVRTNSSGKTEVRTPTGKLLLKSK